MKLYRGYRVNGTQAVVMADNLLLSFDEAVKLRGYIWEIGPEWGYNGTGPTMLSLAILLDCFGDSVVALKWYEAFRDEFIGPADYKGFIILQSQIDNWLVQKLNNKGE
jgi:hypothetical protein